MKYPMCRPASKYSDVFISEEEMTMLEPKPCPAGKCDAQIYCVGELVFCPKCKEKNPNFHAHTIIRTVTKPVEKRVAQMPMFDPETGTVKW